MISESTSSSRPRLLVLSPSVDMYGSDRSMLPVLEVLAKTCSVTLVAPADGPLLSEAARIGCVCLVLDDWALRRKMLTVRDFPATVRRVRSSLRFIAAQHRREPFDAVYANTIANALLPFVKRAVPAPLVVHVRELPRDRPWLMRALLRVVSRVADSVVCNSAFTAETAIRTTTRLADRVRVSHNGVAAPEQAPLPSAGDGVLDIVCVGRVHPKKGHTVLIEAMRLAHESGSRWRLHIHGDALPEHAQLAAELVDQVEAAGLDQDVIWHGYSSDVDRMYDHADVVVVPSVITEEFSRTAAEAQIRGLPVVATGPGGASEVIDDGVSGLIVPPNDPAALVAALVRVEAPAVRAAWGAAGRARAEALFGEDQYAARIVRYLMAAMEDRPTVAVLSPSSDLYGSDRALLHALPGLLEKRDVVIAVAASGPLVAAARMIGAAVVVFPDFAARRRYLDVRAIPVVVIRNFRAAHRIRSLVKRRRAIALYVNTVAVPMLPILRLLTHLPVLVHVHERARGRGWEQLIIASAVKRGADLVVANSEFTASTLGIDASRVDIEVVHNGVDPAPLAEPDPDGPKRLVCVARLHPKKGQWILLDAVARLVADGHDLAVDLVGDALPEHAALEDELRSQVGRLGLEGRVVFHGYLSTVDSIYHRAHVVVVPSVDPEEFSLVAAEGQMRGLAAVVTGPGGVSEVVVDGETGVVVAPDDIGALAAAIARLLDDPELMAAMGVAGRNRMLTYFTVDRYQRRMAEMVDRLVGA